MPKDTKGQEKEKAQARQTLEKGIKSRERVRDAGEVFTQPREVKAMCDLCEPLISEIDKKVLEPACGNGNFLVEILDRKLQKTKKNKYKILIALSNIYGVDIAQDNLEEARVRMKNIVLDFLAGEETPASFLMAMDAILKANICYGNMLTGRKKINLINWIPDGNGGFELEKWNFVDIEKLREGVKQTNVEDLPKVANELLHPPLKLPDKPKPKPKKKVEKQATLF